MKAERIDAYQHVRNPKCIYRRIGDTNVFAWEMYKRSEAGLIADMYDKFMPYIEKQ